MRSVQAVTIPRPEYPRPSFTRADWLNLNGSWSFETDQGDSGLERGLLERELTGTITVPFPPESELSGIEDRDFLEAVWYRRTVTVPADWAGRQVLLHFGAVDSDATVWVDGVELARHRGGYTSFTVDLGPRSGELTITVRARDTHRGAQARGKQSPDFAPDRCLYTRVTGIWQTVWLEPVPATRLGRTRITPDVAGSTFHLEQPLVGDRAGHTVRVTLHDEDGEVLTASVAAGVDLAPRLALRLPAGRVRLWGPADPALYDLLVELVDGAGTVVDAVQTYAGLRSVSLEGPAVLVNGDPVFQRLVLDQGWYPDGLLTAPTDDDLVRDIRIAQAAGFNGARLHQKVFEERFLFHADRLGYLVWGEFPDWGASVGGGDEHQQPTASFVTQWLEELERDFSHPSIVGWCGLNETHQLISDRITILDDVTHAMFLAAKAMDTSRPVLDASGYSHRVAVSDVWDAHDYTQDPDELREHLAGLAERRPYTNVAPGSSRAISVPYRGQPWFLSEFGGIWWSPGAPDTPESWGYGDRPRSAEEYLTRFEGLTGALLDDPHVFGYCYTQLTDVFQEQNGVYGFDRSEKVDTSRLRDAQRRPAAVERQRPARRNPPQRDPATPAG